MAKQVEASIDNERGRAPLLLVCDHASNSIPERFGGLGLSPEALADHVAWDIGALALARRLASALDAALISAPVSRLVIDPNRAHDAPDLIPAAAEGAPVPGNIGPGNLALADSERAARIRDYHDPFHDAIASRLAAQPGITALVSVHSFTPALHGKARPWHAGILHRADARLADVMLAELSRDVSLNIGRNQPYAPEQGVFYTMDRHAGDRHAGDRHAGGRATVMIEVRNDLLRDEAGLARWTLLLAGAISKALAANAERRQAS